MLYLPAELRKSARLLQEAAEERHVRRLAVADYLRRRRRLAGLTYRQVAQATKTDPSRISRYEHGWQHPSDAMAERILEAITGLEKEGQGDPVKAAEAKAIYAAADAAAAGSAK